LERRQAVKERPKGSRVSPEETLEEKRFNGRSGASSRPINQLDSLGPGTKTILARESHEQGKGRKGRETPAYKQKCQGG